jgi:DNA repair ATPase RecN
MKIKNIQLQNFAKYDQVNVSFDDNVTYLIGKNGSGKSTIGITAIWFMFQGIAEKASCGNNPLIGERFRFIGNKAATAKGEMVLYDEVKGIEVKVMRKLTKTGTDLSFIGPDGMVLDQKWLTDLFNIFLIAPKRFQELSPRDQAKAIGIDTSKYDTELADLKKKYTEINAVYRSYGDITPMEEVKAVDITALQHKKQTTQFERSEQRKGISNRLNDEYLKNKQENKDAKDSWELSKKSIDEACRLHNEQQADRRVVFNKCSDALAILMANGFSGEDAKSWIKTIADSIQPDKTSSDQYQPEPTYKEERPDDKELTEFDQQTHTIMAAIDADIQSANEANQKAIVYTQYLDKVKQKEAKGKELSDNQSDQKAKEEARLNYIKGFELPFGNMTIGEDGELLLSGKPIKEPYFSTGELLKIIPVIISTSNPELKYVFLQDFNLLDDVKQEEITEFLVSKGYQLVIEYVGKETMVDKNCILLKDNVIVESYEAEKMATLEV